MQDAYLIKDRDSELVRLVKLWRSVVYFTHIGMALIENQNTKSVFLFNMSGLIQFFLSFYINLIPDAAGKTNDSVL